MSRLVWADPFTIDVGGLLIGLRTTPALDEALRGALAPLLRPDIEAPVNYSLHPAGDPRSFHVLYWGGCSVVRTRDPRRLAAALAQHLGGHGTPAPGHLRLHGSAVVLPDGRAAVLPALRSDLARVDRALRAQGCAVVDSPYVDIEPEAMQVVVAPPSLPAAVVEGLGALGDAVGGSGEETAVAPGRWALAGFALPPPFEHGRSAVLHRLLQLVDVEHRGQALDVLGRLSGLPAVELDGASPRSVAAIRSLTRS